MTSNEVRKKFIDFFQSEKHIFKQSSPIVIKDDPTLLFVNAGMNQFKEFFLDNKTIVDSKVVNSQKCLRVSGKHNDLEEVGHDTYHHTMFEMLGNWSFGDYFKQEAINLAWRFLTNELKISSDRLYVSYFYGDKQEGLKEDLETRDIWRSILHDDKIVPGSKKDNFWEMGKNGPCGPSTEIHIDLRSDNERSKISANDLINKDHPQVIEIWNIVFIEFNRKEDGNLELLPKKHVDTGMGFERLCMVLQNKTSTYDTDIFSSLISAVSTISNISYGYSNKTDIAIRVIVDHIRAIGFSIADGQLPSNTGAGYVIRRILRRAVRYGYTYLQLTNPFLFQLTDKLCEQFQDIFPEMCEQKDLIKSVVEQEERMFLKTLGKGLELINKSINSLDSNVKEMSGENVFELYDTYGFPPDLTSLILKEKGLVYNQLQFDCEMQKQKARSRSAAEINLGDWVEVNNIPVEGFVGYDDDTCVSKMIKYRKVKFKGEDRYHVIFDKTPFYPEGGGQIGDTGYIVPQAEERKLEQYYVLDTKRENNMIIHVMESLPILSSSISEYILMPDLATRILTTRNHSATHLLHYVLRMELGDHVEQKGSYVGSDYFRFDFSHFEKISQSQLLKIEKRINDFIASGVMLKEFRQLPIEQAKKMGALSLFGEKYGDNVRVIKYGDSIELCGGTHVQNTSEIGLVKILSESSVAAGIRRIEAVTSIAAIEFLNKQMKTLSEIQSLLKNSDNIIGSVQNIIATNKSLSILADAMKKKKTNDLIQKLSAEFSEHYSFNILFTHLDIDPSSMKNICFQLVKHYDNAFIALVTKKNNKIILNIALSKKLVEKKDLHAAKIINEFGHYINAKGGGQSFFAVASGDLLEGVSRLFDALKEKLKSL